MLLIAWPSPVTQNIIEFSQPANCFALTVLNCFQWFIGLHSFHLHVYLVKGLILVYGCSLDCVNKPLVLAAIAEAEQNNCAQLSA